MIQEPIWENHPSSRNQTLGGKKKDDVFVDRGWLKIYTFFSGTELFKNRVDIYSFGPDPLTEHDNLTSSRIYVHDIKARSATETIFLSPEKRDQTKQFSKKGKR